MAEVAAVYAIAPHVREPADIIRELRPVQDADTQRARPKPVNKRAWASVKREAGDVIRDAFDDAERRDPGHARRWVVLVDGNESQIEHAYAEARRLGVHATVIVDLIHVLEYVWRAAFCFYADGSSEAEAWVTTRLRMLLEGVDPSDVAAGMRRSATRQGLELIDAPAPRTPAPRTHARLRLPTRRAGRSAGRYGGPHALLGARPARADFLGRDRGQRQHAGASEALCAGDHPGGGPGGLGAVVGARL
jgi:hypothetical protein